jgi:hypothetical protein
MAVDQGVADAAGEGITQEGRVLALALQRLAAHAASRPPGRRRRRRRAPAGQAAGLDDAQNARRIGGDPGQRVSRAASSRPPTSASAAAAVPARWRRARPRRRAPAWRRRRPGCGRSTARRSRPRPAPCAARRGRAGCAAADRVGMGIEEADVVLAQVQVVDGHVAGHGSRPRARRAISSTPPPRTARDMHAGAGSRASCRMVCQRDGFGATGMPAGRAAPPPRRRGPRPARQEGILRLQPDRGSRRSPRTAWRAAAPGVDDGRWPGEKATQPASASSAISVMPCPSAAAVSAPTG